MNAPTEHTIVISPIGDLDALLLSKVRSGIERVFGYSTMMIPLLDDLGFAFEPLRNQYHSTVVLEKLSRLTPRQAIRVIAISDVDLFIPILTHVFGEAQLGGKACILSIYRLKESDALRNDPDTFHSRILKEAIHEMGHTFGLRHCQDRACIMHYCRTVMDVDRKSRQLCRYCKVLLEDETKRLAEK